MPAEPGRPPLLVLAGPTASGKTAIALNLAERHGLEILSADSMAVYRGMDIGTAKPSPAERRRVPHHGIDVVDPREHFDAARYAALADRVIEDAHRRGVRLLVVGGTPLYLMALLRGFFAGPAADPELRARLLADEERRPGVLHERLASVDPAAAARIHRNDRKRLVRALEVHELTGRPISALQRQFDEGPPRHPYRGVRLVLSREALRARVRRRTRAMFEAGLVAEVQRLLERGLGPTAGQAIGYKEVVAHLRGRLPADRLETKIRAHTHRLVRRQENWFRTFPGLAPVPVEGLDLEAAASAVAAALGLG